MGNTAYRTDFRQSGGSSLCIVVDVGEWDGSLFTSSPGRSGDPESPHYSDLFDDWAEGEAFPLLYFRKIEESTERRIVLEPKGK